MQDTTEAWGGAIGTDCWEITNITHPADGIAQTSTVTYVGPRGKLGSTDIAFDIAVELREGQLLPEEFRP